MPTRTAICLLFVLLSATAVAREFKMSSPAGGSCSSSEADVPEHDPKPLRAAPAPVLPARDPKPRPSLHSDSPRLMPRWHSFLPGMFR